MKPKDITEYNHPERHWKWIKSEVEFINARVNLAYEEGRKDALAQPESKHIAWKHPDFDHAVFQEERPKFPEEDWTKLYTDPVSQPEQSEPVAYMVKLDDVTCFEYVKRERSISLYTHPAPPLRELNYEELLEAISRGWCTPVNEKKVMDSDLAIAIAEEVVKYIAAARKTP